MVAETTSLNAETAKQIMFISPNETSPIQRFIVQS
jgi:hypothetical protein